MIHIPDAHRHSHGGDGAPEALAVNAWHHGPMRLTILGCSGSLGGPRSAASGHLVQVDGFAPLVVDFGPGVLGVLQRYVPPESVTVLLTHLHADHCLDMPGLLVWRRYGPCAETAGISPIFGPSGTAYRIGVASAEEPGAVDDISDTFAVRTWDEEPDVELPALREGGGSIAVRATRVDHPPESYGLRLTAPSGRVLAYSGDTAYCSAVVEVARGADVFLCEASWTHPGEHPPGMHMSGVDAGRVAREAGVGKLVLTHIPPWTDREAVAAEARAEFDGEVVLASEGLQIEI